MREQLFKVTLKQDVILSAQSATEGQHQSLDFLPGSVFLGVAAGRGYSQLSPMDAWSLFHSGHIRFTDALPYEHSEIGLPTPLSFHAFKGERFTLENDSDQLDATRVFDPALLTNTETLQQPKQIRKGYISESGRRLQPSLGHRMKTAIDPSAGRAATGQLYGYQALEAGQTFVFSIQTNDGYENLFAKAIEWVTGHAHLGRSRSAQYGSVDITPITEPASAIRQSDNQSATLTLWLKSDLALLGADGQPSLIPDPVYLGLPQGSLWNSDKSYIRTRHYSPYNAKRRSYDPERQVICRGSVLRFDLSTPLDTAQLHKLTQIGLYQSAGLGQVIVNPMMLVSANPNFRDASVSNHLHSSPKHPILAPNSPLIRLLEQRAEDYLEQDKAGRMAELIFKELCSALEKARNWNGIRSKQSLEVAPGRTQWGGIKALANDLRLQPDTLWEQLFKAKNAVVRPRFGWELEIGPGQTLASHMESLFEAHHLNPSENLHEILGRLAVLGMSRRWTSIVEGTAMGESTSETQQMETSA